jgi:hypothetical protein
MDTIYIARLLTYEYVYMSVSINRHTVIKIMEELGYSRKSYSVVSFVEWREYY